jgi:hypothetical protein
LAEKEERELTDNVALIQKQLDMVKEKFKILKDKEVAA